MNHAEFEAYLCDELREHRPDFSEDDARELAATMAGAVADTVTARRMFLASYRSAKQELT